MELEESFVFISLLLFSKEKNWGQRGQKTNLKPYSSETAGPEAKSSISTTPSQTESKTWEQLGNRQIGTQISSSITGNSGKDVRGSCHPAVVKHQLGRPYLSCL